LGHHVFKTRKWIGTTEVYTLLTYLGIRSTIIDFHQPGPKRLHKDLMDWIQSYFMDSTTQHQKTVHITNKPPLYLQHQGHSRTVVGIEILKTGKRNLIMFDPGRRMLRSYKSSKQEAEEVENQTQDEDEDEGEDEEIDILGNDSSMSISKRFFKHIKYNKHLPKNLLKPFRVDDKTIGKHKQYSVLVLGQVNYQDGKMAWDSNKGYLLNEDERELMKNVTSLAVL
jgi:hypothetical protein